MMFTDRHWRLRVDDPVRFACRSRRDKRASTADQQEEANDLADENHGCPVIRSHQQTQRPLARSASQTGLKLAEMKSPPVLMIT